MSVDVILFEGLVVNSSLAEEELQEDKIWLPIIRNINGYFVIALIVFDGIINQFKIFDICGISV